MSQKVLTYKNLAIVIGCYMVILAVFFFVAAPQIKYSPKAAEGFGINGVVGEVCEGRTIRQRFVFDGTYIQNITLMSGTYNRQNEGSEIFTLKNLAGEIIWEEEIPAKELKNDVVLNLMIKKDISQYGSEFFLEITGKGNQPLTAPTFYKGENPAAYGSIEDNKMFVDGNLYINIYGRKESHNQTVFCVVAILTLAAIVIIWFSSMRKLRQGRNNLLICLLNDYGRYKFLVKQLVLRDFKTKYKRSALGILWSFLNPILTMTVQYIVFSTIFRSGIENFPVYLLSASILFNFFNESVGNGLGSITGNVSLITKVAIPKYIYPVSRVLSSAINLLLSSIPLLIVVLITGENINMAYLCIPFLYGTLLIFCLGFGMLLATSMVYFRDTQFLWGIVSLLWMYATPIFYPETIIPNRFRFILRCNPMYYYLKFFRTILMDEMAPDMFLFVMCIVWAVVMLAVGALVFEKYQKKFTLYV